MSVRSPSIGRRLMRLSVICSATALLLAGIVLFAYDVLDVRRTLVSRLHSVASLLAYNSASAIDFNDAESAALTLASLQTRAGIISASIVVQGRNFATYIRPGGKLPESNMIPSASEGHRFSGQQLVVARAIEAEGRPLGTLIIQSDLREIRGRLVEYAVILGLVFVTAVLATALISRRLRNTISEPILSLAALGHEVSTRQDYSLRAPDLRSVAEVDQLVATFNEMLEEIQASRATLERRVDERTRELAAANKELEAFSYSVSHDLRAPLRAIDGFSRALISDYTGKPLDQRGVHYLERVRAGTQKMGALIDDMLHLARVTRSTLERRDVDVTAIARGVAMELERRHPDRKVSLHVQEGMSAFADPHLLRIVFDNLLGNAWKFTGKTDEARVEAGMANGDGRTVFFVRDNGAGFDMTYASKLFSAFQRLHHDSEFEGTGIGLATVQRIVHRHGGEIWAEGEEGRGATFQFTLGGKQ